jgi:hypothetical protein
MRSAARPDPEIAVEEKRFPNAMASLLHLVAINPILSEPMRLSARR